MLEAEHLDRPRSGFLKGAVTVVSVAAAIIVAKGLNHYWKTEPFASLFFCAIILSAWFGGYRQGLLATALSALAFDYWFLQPIGSLLVNSNELPRLIFFLLCALLVGFLAASQMHKTASLRRARDDLAVRIADLKQINELLNAEKEERKRAEMEALTHLWFLESMDRINRAIQGTNDLEALMSEVLKVVLSIFNCDRAWLVQPGDPQAPTWRAVMEHVQPEFPGAFALGIDLPLDPEVAAVFARVRGSSSSVCFGPESDDLVPSQLAERFSIRSMLGLALYPKFDQPYIFGLHQCTHARVWTLPEQRLFREIGRRMEDALSALLMFRSLQNSELKLEEAQRIAHVGHWERDLDTDLTSCSNETYRIFGLVPQNHFPGLSELTNLLHPEDRQKMIQAVADAVNDVRPYNVEYRVIRPTGEVRFVHSVGSVVKDESGRPRRRFGTVQDITERKLAEEALRQAQADLAHVSRVTTMGELTASIAHEVNQPLAAVVNNAHASLSLLPKDTPGLQEVREALTEIIEDANRASDIIARVRQLAKRVPVAKLRLDLSEVVNDVLGFARYGSTMRHVTIRTDLSPDLPSVSADRVQLQQVLLNLVINGMDAMNQVEESKRVLTIYGRRETHDGAIEALLSVSDSGVGLKPQAMERLFEAFYTTKTQGMGMGLAISRSIIEAHGGRMWAETRPGPGATFSLSLPSVQSEGSG